MTHPSMLYIARVGNGAADTAASMALLRAVEEGSQPETFRLHRATRVVAFGGQDVVAPGYRDAVEAVRAAGFLPVERLAGGRAAVFHEGTVAFSWATPTDQPRRDITARFQWISHLLAEALNRLGARVRVGEVPGEYCPGAFSLNIDGRYKVMGVGQRLVRGAAHVGGVIVVSGAGAIRDVLVPVYEHLGIDWRPETTGSLDMAVPDVTVADVVETVAAVLFEERESIDIGELPPEIVAAGTEGAARFLPGGR